MTQLIRFDWAIKHILRDKANFDILEGFLSELLLEDIEIQQLLESESNQENERDKFNRVDLLVKNKQEELIIIEIQSETEYDYFQRMLFATAKAIVENIQLGQPYSVIKKVIIVSIIYFDLGQGEDYLYHGTTNFIGRHKHDELKLSEKQQSLFSKARVCELYPEYYAIKVEQFDDVIRELFDEWIYFLKHEEIKAEFQAQGLPEAKEKLAVLQMPPEIRRAYNNYLENLHYMASMAQTYNADIRFKMEELRAEVVAQHAKGREKGREEGREEGELKKALEIARQLLDVLDDETISRKTGLSLEQVQQLREATANNE